MEKFKWLMSCLWGCVCTFFRQYALIITFTACAVVLDWITGVVKAKTTGEGLNSRKATVGFWKKVALFVALFFGFFLDYFIPYVADKAGISLPINSLFGMIFGCYIVINEAISICENLYACNPTIMPKWIVSILTQAKEQIDSKKEGENNEQ